MPNPSTWQDWFRVGDELLSDARALLGKSGPSRSLKRAAAQAAEAYLKGLLAHADPGFLPRGYGHDLARLHTQVAAHWPSLAPFDREVRLLQHVEFQTEGDSNGSCKVHCESYYEPDLVQNEDEDAARVAVAEQIREAAIEAVRTQRIRRQI